MENIMVPGRAPLLPLPRAGPALILHGCKFARDLEPVLGDLVSQPETLSKSCDGIVNIFATAKERLNNAHGRADPSLQEWLKYGVITHAMGEIQAIDVSDSAKGSSSSSHRSHTRAYYKCTHQKMYNCPTKKQVQRLDNDFYTFEVTYFGQHTCHASSTAPSIAPPHQMVRTHAMVSQPTLSPLSVAPLRTWLSMEFSLGLGSGSSSGGRRGGDASASAAAASGDGATTGSRYGRDVAEYPMVADMADAMFNSGSSSSNSMDFIFLHVGDKWEAGDKEN